MMTIRPLKFDEKYAISQLNNMHKEGYCSVLGLVAFIRNEYRDISVEQAVKTINKWIDEYKIKHEYLVVLFNKSKQMKQVVVQSFADEVKRRLQK